MKQLLFLFFISSMIWACETEVKSNPNKAETTPVPAPTAAVEQAVGETYPSIPAEEVKILWDSSDYVDIVFYYEDFSISQKNQSDIRGMLNYISSNVPQINANCQPIGRIFFQIQGRNAAEADIFFTQGCTYFLFYKDGKKAYANGFTESGAKFFNQIFASVKAQKPK